MEKIYRKSLIYKTGVEYGDYTLNHVFGCKHGCRYPCYAFQMMKRFKKVASYEEWCKPKIVENALELVDREIVKYKNKINILHLCFSTDPFMQNVQEVCDLSLNIIKKVNSHNVPCSVLTKGILPKELSYLNHKNEYGITLISLDEHFRERMEPGTAPILDRINALKYLHDKGCKTWVSIEPYPTPNLIDQNIIEILEEIKFVDKIIFGRMHYNKIVSEYKDYKLFYNECVNDVIEFCNSNKIAYYIKKGTVTD